MDLLQEADLDGKNAPSFETIKSSNHHIPPNTCLMHHPVLAAHVHQDHPAKQVQWFPQRE